MNTELQFQLLNTLEKNPSVPFGDIMQSIPVKDLVTAKKVLSHLKKEGLICGSLRPGEHLSITPKGVSHLTQLTEYRNRCAQEERYRRRKDEFEDKRYRKDAVRSWSQLAIQIVVSLLSLILGAILTANVEFLNELFSFG